MSVTSLGVEVKMAPITENDNKAFSLITGADIRNGSFKIGKAEARNMNKWGRHCMTSALLALDRDVTQF
jgi:hypothetical protein